MEGCRVDVGLGLGREGDSLSGDGDDLVLVRSCVGGESSVDGRVFAGR